MFPSSPRLLLLGTLLVAGCSVPTTGPLSDPLTGEPDRALYAHWVATVKDEGKTRESHLFIGKHTTRENPASLMEAVMVSWDVGENKVESVPVRYFTVTRIGKSSYMNLIDVEGPPHLNLSEVGSYMKWAKDEKRTCQVVRYRCDGKSLRLWGTEDPNTAVRKLSEAGEIKLIDKVVTADSLVKYLRAKGGEGLFNKLAATYTKSR